MNVPRAAPLLRGVTQLAVGQGDPKRDCRRPFAVVAAAAHPPYLLDD